jgi:tetratricopeptide (TPR) repeat protein
MALEGFELARQRGHRHLALSFSCWEVFFLLAEGRWDAGFALADEFFPEQPTVLGIVATAQTILAAASLDRGDRAEARRRLGLVAPEALESTIIQDRAMSLLHAAVSAIEDGRPNVAMQSLAAEIELEFEQDTPQGAGWPLGLAGTVAQEHGLFRELAELVARFDGVPERKQTRVLVGELGRARGIVAAHAGHENEAADAFGIALAAARSAGDRWQEAEILTDYGRSLVAFGRPDEAEELLAEAVELWQQMGATTWLERIEAIRPKAKVGA